MIPLFFQQNLFKANARSELENDAKLALHLLLYLLASQNRHDGAWPGIHTAATMRNTCHALEALHLLGRDIAAEAIEAGVAWLANLPEIFEIAPEDEDSIRLYPSRFKTLAWLDAFSEAHVGADFEELEEHLDEEGLLQGIMPKQLLATMIYVDCLDHLEEKLGLLPAASQIRRSRALQCVQRYVWLWQQNLDQKEPFAPLANVGDLSYALDLLVRARRLSPQDELSGAILDKLVAALAQPESLRSIPTDILYCGIQLITHFPEVPQAREAVRRLIGFLRVKYEQLDLRREVAFFHPLVLRVLHAYHGERLKAEMIRLLLAQEQRNLELRREHADQSLKNDFKALLKRKIEVEISEVQSLTGGMTKAEIYRVHFFLKLASLGEGQETRVETYRPNPGSLVIKSGSQDSLNQSIERYRSLPTAIRPYFARHAGDLQTLNGGPVGQSYLVMEDLTYMDTLHDILNRIDQGSLSNFQRSAIERACDTLCAGLFATYDQTKRSDTDFLGIQLSRLYLSDLGKNLFDMCRADKFPHLKAWLRGFWLGERKYPSLEYYLRKIESHRARLKVPYLMLTHGDCHSRNIMLDDNLQQLKLIDLDHLNEDGDYIQDLALLLEDVSIFRFLFYERYRFHVDKDQIAFVSDAGEQAVIENKIEYRPFSSEAVRLFQHRILRNLSAYAESISDESWKERLWLALAKSLIYLVGRQMEKEYATVLYVEAVKLLDSLVSYLDKDVPLETLPFPGRHPAGVRSKPGLASAGLPSWYETGSVLAYVHNGIIAFDPGVKYEVTSSGRVTQYFTTSGQYPFAIIDGKKQPPSVLLACSPQTLKDPVGMAETRDTGSAFRIVLRVSEQTEAASVLGLIRQAFELTRDKEYFHHKDNR